MSFLRRRRRNLSASTRRSTSSWGKSGVDRFEAVLELLNLSEQVPKPITDEFYKAQMVRKVWAHNAGIADAKFVRQAAHLGFKQGDLVAITTEQLFDYLGAILVYTWIIMNRHRALHRLDPMPLGDDPMPALKVSSPLKDAYESLYPPMQHSEQDTTVSASGTSP